MTVYLLLAVYLFVIQAVFGGKSRLKETLFCTIGFVLVLSLRSPYNGCDLVGGSTTIGSSYYGYFTSMQSYSFADIFRFKQDFHFEVGFLTLTKLITMVTDDFQIYMSINAILQFVPLAYFIHKYSPKITFSFFIFGCLPFFSFYCSGLRQGLAISIGLIAIDYLIQKRWIWFIAIALLDTTIHTSAILCFSLLPFYKQELTFGKAATGFIIVLMLLPVIRTILMWFSITFLSGRYGSYLEESASSALTMFFVYGILLFASYLYKKESFIVNNMRWCVLIGLFFQSFGFINNSSITRGGLFFLICLTILLPYIITSLKDKSQHGLVLIVAELLLCVFFYLTAEGPRNIVPYYFFWEKPL